MKKSTSVYLLLGLILFIVLHVSTEAGMLLASLIPVRLRSPEGEGGGSGGEGEGGENNDTITLTQKEYKERMDKQFRNGNNQGRETANKKFKELFEASGIAIVEDDFSKTLAGIQESLKKAGEGKEQQVIELEAKLKAALQDAAAAKELVGRAERETADYIVNNELLKVLGSKSVNPNAAALLIRQDARIEKLKDGTIKVYDKSGNQIFDEKGDPIGLGGYVDKFLADPNNDYLVKSEQRSGGQGGTENTGISKSLNEKAATNPMGLSDTERETYIKNFK